MFDFITQAIGILGTTSNVISYQFKKKYIMYILQFLGTVFFMIHYALLGSLGGCIVNSIGVIRSIYLIVRKDKKSVVDEFILASLFIVAAVITIIIKQDTYLALLPGIGSFVQTVGLWRKSPKKTRWIQLLGVSPLWIIYNIVNCSIGGILCEGFTIISAIIYLIRYKNDNENDVI